jgi:ankyrin repeat protein
LTVAAAARGDTKKLSALIKKQPAILEHGNAELLLQTGAAGGHPDICKLLIDDHNTDINTDCQFGGLTMGPSMFMTPLMAACQHGQIGCVRVLLQSGADPSKQSRDHRQSPLHCAADAPENAFGMCELLLTAGADPDPDDVGKTRPLGFAASNGNNRVCALLLKNSADPDHMNDHGAAMHSAAYGGHVDTCRLLTQSGAHLDLKAAVSVLRAVALQTEGLCARTGSLQLALPDRRATRTVARC